VSASRHVRNRWEALRLTEEEGNGSEDGSLSVPHYRVSWAALRVPCIHGRIKHGLWTTSAKAAISTYFNFPASNPPAQNAQAQRQLFSAPSIMTNTLGPTEQFCLKCWSIYSRDPDIEFGRGIMHGKSDDGYIMNTAGTTPCKITTLLA